MQKLFDKVIIGLSEGVIVKVRKKRKWTYYDIVFEDAELSSNDFQDNLIEYETYREDDL